VTARPEHRAHRGRRRRAPGIDYRQEPYHAEHGGIEQRTREQRRDRGWAFAVGIRQPGVHGRETDLGAETYERQKEGEQQQGVRGMRGHEAQAMPSHVIDRTERKGAGPVEEDDPQEREREPGRDDDDVLPGASALSAARSKPTRKALTMVVRSMTIQ